MSRGAHFLYISTFIAATLFVILYLSFKGFSYYNESLEERYFHPDNNLLKSSGIAGHSLGIAGSLSIIVGVGTYMARKRFRSLYRIGILKYWLELHIFLCIIGTFLIIFHTAFKFGGLAAVSFWSMVVTFLSGIAGRVIYLQIPRSQEGREYELREVRELRSGMETRIKDFYDLDEKSFQFISLTVENRYPGYPQNRQPGLFKRRLADWRAQSVVRRYLSEIHLRRSEIREIMSLISEDIKLGRKIESLERMKNLFRYWHVAHLPFALIMLIFMILHIIVTVTLGYKWIF